MQKILILQGLPASGKTTFAKELLNKNPNYIRINKDDLRSMLHGGKYSRDNEKVVIKTRDLIISSALENGKNVIVDDTNFAQKHIDRITELADIGIAKVEIKYFDISVKECINRDLKRVNSVGEKVIRDMYKQFVEKKETIEEIDGLELANKLTNINLCQKKKKKMNFII